MKRFINSLPNELLSEIFIAGAYMPTGPGAQGLPLETLVGGTRLADTGAVRPTRFASLVGLVCKLWRNITLVTPLLWAQVRLSDIDVDFERSQEILERSKRQPVDLNIDIDVWPVAFRTQRRLELCMEILAAHIHHCRTLTISSPDIPCDVIILKALSGCPAAPMLESLDFSNVYTEAMRSLFRGSQLPRLRRLHPGLRSICTTLRSIHRFSEWGWTDRLTSLDITSLHYSGPPDVSRICLPAMHTLRLRIHPQALLHILRILDMPELRALSLDIAHTCDNVLRALWSQPAERGLLPLSRVTHVVLHNAGLHSLNMYMLYDALPNVRWMQLQFHHLSVGFFEGLSKRTLAQLETLVMFGVARKGVTWAMVAALARERQQGGAPLKTLVLDPPQGSVEAVWSQICSSVVARPRVLWDPQEPYPVYV